MEDNVNKSPKKIISIIIFLIVVFLLFNINIKSFAESTSFKKNINYAKQELEVIYSNYLLRPIKYIWDNIIFENFLKANSSTYGKLFQAQDIPQNNES